MSKCFGSNKKYLSCGINWKGTFKGKTPFLEVFPASYLKFIAASLQRSHQEKKLCSLTSKPEPELNTLNSLNLVIHVCQQQRLECRFCFWDFPTLVVAVWQKQRAIPMLGLQAFPHSFLLWKGGGGRSSTSSKPTRSSECRDSESICLFSQQTPTGSSALWQQLRARGNHPAKLGLILCSWTILTQLANKLPSIGSEAEVQTSFCSCTVEKWELSVFNMWDFHSLCRACFQTHWGAVPQHRKAMLKQFSGANKTHKGLCLV